VGLCPGFQGADEFQQAGAELGQLVVDARGDDRVHGPGDQAVAFQGTQRRVPEPVAEMVADSDRAAAEGALFVPKTDLENLLGRPVTPLSTAIGAALA
jgi:hypothetical protein